MLVSFNPMINTASTADAAYMNFLRCVKAICTAAQGTTTLTVNPILANNGTSDATRNCILQIFANSEAGGWTESTSSNVIQPGTSFTAIASMTAFQYKFDAFNSSGKGLLPFNKLCFHTNGASASCNWYGQRTLPTQAQFSGYPQVFMTFGASTTSDWTDTRFIPGGRTDGNGSPNQGYNTAGASGSNNQNQSSTCNGFMSSSSTYWGLNSMNVFALNRIFYLSVTANYCILWEQPANNSYTVAPFYANDLQLIATAGPQANGQSPIYNNSSYTSPFYGSLYYGGLRETQSWENAISTNPPWVVMQYGFHRYLTPANSTSSVMNTTANFMSASLCTINDSGVVNTTPTTYVISNTSSAPGNNFDCPAGHNSSYNLYVNTRGGAQNHTGTSPASGILSPFITKDFTGQPSYVSIEGGVCNTNQLYMPTVDPVTGTAVPSAFPIVARRLTSNSWTPGGAIRGLYRSLAMPIATMKNYFAPGQTFNIYNSVTATTDTYIPIIFNEDMFLVRYA